MRSKEKKRTLTIRKEIFLLGFLFLILVSLLYGVIFLKLLYDSNVQFARNSLRECNSQIVTYTEGMFHENETVIRILSENETVIYGGYGNRSEVIGIFDSVHALNSNITYIYSGYADGSLYIDDYSAPSGYDATGRPWYTAAVAADGVARLVYADAATGVWLFSQCMKLTDSTGAVTGAVAIDCSNESISKQLSAKYQYTSQRSFIMNAEGIILLHPKEEIINRSMREWMSAEDWSAVLNGQDNYAEYVKDGVTAMAYFEKIPNTELTVVTSINASEIRKPIVEGTAVLFVLTLCSSVLLGYILSRVLIYRFARPIVELRGRIGSLAAGKPVSSREIHFFNEEINGIAESIEIIVNNIANREEQRKAAEYLSFHDSMTGLYNRRYFEEEMARADIPENYPLTVICCDINGLKLVNDIFGHAVGDQLISCIAGCLKSTCGEGDIAARTGGDEFNMLLLRTSAAEAEQFVRKAENKFHGCCISGAEVSASLGFAVKEAEEQGLDEVLRLADERMYRQKVKGSAEMKNRTVANIVAAAENERLVIGLTEQENNLIERLALSQCPESAETLKISYRLRKIGLCSILPSAEYSPEVREKRHTEDGYRILSATDSYRGIAGYVLHYQEHWDGSGFPTGLSGWDIPLLSRIMALVEGCSGGLSDTELADKSGKWFDPELAAVLLEADRDEPGGDGIE